ncbi:MAG TPA: hypothetical protein VMR95_01500, partial [Candidatus Binatia bacterium]|nr:hypothetical protein [Candidatus Binatia bacterium]
MPKTKAKPKTPSLKRSKPAPKSKPKIATEAQSRKFKISAYKSFRIHKKIKSDLPILPSAIKLFWRSLQVLWKNKRLFLGIVVVYGLLNLILVHGLASNGDLGSLKSSLSNTFLGTGGKIGSSLTLYAYLLGGGSNTSSA